MEEGLRIRVGTDVVEVTKSLSQLESDFKQLQKTIANTTDGKELVQLNRRLSDLGTTITAVRNAGRVGFDDFGQKLGAIKPAANGATQAMTDLGRVLQDAPYGFIGIANNLNPLLESFTRLRKETGSTGGAISAFVGSLKGAGGLGLALSAVSAALSFAQLGMSMWTRRTGEAKKKVAELSGFLGTTKDELAKINDSFASEASRVTVLVNALEKGTLSHEKIRSAKEELIRISPEYFSNIDKENTKISDVTEAYTNYNNALIKSIENQIKTEKLTKAISDRLKVEEKNPLGLAEFNKLLGSGKSLDDIIGDVGKVNLKQTLQDVNKLTGLYANTGQTAQLALQQQQKKTDDLNESNRSLNTELYKVANAYKAVRDILGTIDPKVTKIKPKDIKEEAEKVVEYFQQGLQRIDISELIKNKKKLGIDLKEVLHGVQQTLAESFGGGSIFGDKAVEGYKNFKKFWEEQAKRDPLFIEAPKIRLESISGRYEQFFTPKMKEDIKNSQKALKDIQVNAASISSAIQAGFQDTLSSIAEGIGNVLGDVANGLGSFKSVGVALSNMLVNVGKAAIGTGVAIEAIKKALESLGGAGAIAAGVALIALGTFVRSKLSEQAAGMALGGIVPPGYPNDSFPARLSSNEAVIPLDRLDAIMGRGNAVSGPMVARLVGAGPDLMLYLEQQRRSTGR